jgi:hypothetical protein
MGNKYDGADCLCAYQPSEASTKNCGKVIYALEAVTLLKTRLVAIYHHACEGIAVVFPFDIVRECVSQPHVLSSLLLERSECVSTKAGDSDNTIRIQLHTVEITLGSILNLVVLRKRGKKSGDTDKAIVKR